MVAMTHRIHRSSRRTSVTSPRRVGLLTSAFTVTALALATPNTAHADPSCPSDHSESARILCGLATTPAPASTGGGGPAWMQDVPDLSFWHVLGPVLIVMGAITMYANRDKSAESATMSPGTARAGAYRAQKRGERAIGAFMIAAGVIALGWALGGVAGLVVGALIGVPVMVISTKTDQDTDLLKTGYAAAEQQYQQQVAQARAAHAAWRPDPAVFDPHGIGVRPPAAPPLQLPAEPQVSDEDARRFARVGAGVEIEPGSAAAQLLATDGSDTAAREAWATTCTAENFVVSEVQASRIPGRPAERITVPAADFVAVRPLPGGDALLVVRPRSNTLSTRELSRITQTFLNTARIRSASDWEREHATNLHSIRLSNAAAPAAPAPEQPAPAPVDDPWS